MINEQVFRLKKNGEPYWNCFCRHPEKIENYDKAIADTTQTWEVHHRKEDTFSFKELKERGEYFDVSSEDLIFLTPTEHRKIDSKCKRHSEAMKGIKFSEGHKRKIGEANSKKVLCIETSEIFDSTVEASRIMVVNQGKISEVCNGKRKTAGGYHWRYM